MNLQQNLQKAMLMFQANKLSEAKKILLKLVKKFPSDANIYGNLALIHIRENSAIQAQEMFQKSLKIDPGNYGVLRNFINFMIQSKSWEQIIKIYPGYVHVLNNPELRLLFDMYYAIALRETGMLDEALAIFENLLLKYPENESLILAYGFSYNKAGKYLDAIEIYKKGLSVSKNNLALNYNMGVTYANIKEYPKSNEFLLAAAQINPNEFGIWITLASNYTKLNKIEKAYECIEECKKIDPNNLLINYQLGYISSHTGDRQKSIEFIKQVLHQDPNHIEANYFMGILHLESEMYENIMQYYRYRTVRENNRHGTFDDFVLPEIRLEDDVLIGKEQGVGDQLLLFRLMDSFIEKVNSITYISEPRLKNIISKLYPKIKVILDDEYDNDKEKYKTYKKINLASIIHYVDNIPETLREKSKKNIKENSKNNTNTNIRKIGISWKSKADKDGIEKSIQLEDLIEIFRINNCVFVNLQYGDVEQEINEFTQKHNIQIRYDNNIDYSNDFDRLTKLIEDCDEVITISNFTVHLAGTLNKETSLLLPKVIGRKWYWCNDEEEYSIWYPSVKKYVQDTDGKWKEPIQKLARDLETRIQTE